MQEKIRAQFPILQNSYQGKNWIYFDNAATTQKPQSVIDALSDYYINKNSNIHRGAHYLANKTTEDYESAREEIASFIKASPKEINFTRGTTESINLLMQCYALEHFSDGDVIVLTPMEHHANIVPWLYLKEKLNIQIRYIPFDQKGFLDISSLDQIIDEKVKLVSLAMVSNALGTIHPIETIIKKAKSFQIPVHLDLAQAIAHFPIDVKALQIDFASFSAHKMFGPTGLGIFWAKTEHLEKMRPFHFGGEMIKEVFLDRFTINELPYKFEAGTPNIADVIAMKEAVGFIKNTDFKNIIEIEHRIYEYLYSKMMELDEIHIYSPYQKSIGALSFNIQDVHPYDVGQMLDSQGIAIRTGHHCCQPLMRALNIEGTCRASLSIYNTEEEIDQFINVLKRVIKILKP
jgi:cysteine desulfurase/selenocysteine lyase